VKIFDMQAGFITEPY